MTRGGIWLMQIAVCIGLDPRAFWEMSARDWLKALERAGLR